MTRGNGKCFHRNSFGQQNSWANHSNVMISPFPLWKLNQRGRSSHWNWYNIAAHSTTFDLEISQKIFWQTSAVSFTLCHLIYEVSKMLIKISWTQQVHRRLSLVVSFPWLRLNKLNYHQKEAKKARRRSWCEFWEEREADLCHQNLSHMWLVSSQVSTIIANRAGRPCDNFVESGSEFQFAAFSRPSSDNEKFIWKVPTICFRLRTRKSLFS